jgi:hypothetical protein
VCEHAFVMSNKRSNYELCGATRKDGSPCRARPLDGGYCLAHSPAHVTQLIDARRKGGQNRSRANRLKRLAPPALLCVYERLEQALIEVHEGQLDPRQAAAMASLASAIVRVPTAGELEQRVRDLEARERRAA